MITSRKLLPASFFGLALFANPASGAPAIILEFPEDASLKGDIPISSYAFQRSAPPITRQCNGAAGGGSFTITRTVDAVSPQLAGESHASTGAVVMLDDRKADGTRLAFQFTNATISKISSAYKSGQPEESISFNYTKVQWLTVGCKQRAPVSRDAPSMGAPYGGGKMGY